MLCLDGKFTPELLYSCCTELCVSQPETLDSPYCQAWILTLQAEPCRLRLMKVNGAQVEMKCPIVQSRRKALKYLFEFLVVFWPYLLNQYAANNLY